MVSNNDILFNEVKGKFTFKNNSIFSLLKFFGFGNSYLNEKDLSINRINQLKKSYNLTTLGDYDINLLYNLAKTKFNFTKDKTQFKSIPLKNIFTNLSDDKLTINKLMPLSKNYLDSIKNGYATDKIIIEKFSIEYRINNIIKLFLLIFIIFLVFIFILAITKPNFGMCCQKI